LVVRLALVMLVLVSGCSDASEPEPRPLVVGTTERRSGLDPAGCYDYLCAYALLPNTHQTLVSLDDAVQPGAGVAESWTVSPDGMSYTFTLRSGQRMHDNAPLDAETVRWSLERVRTLDAAPSFLLFQDAEEPTWGIRSVEAPDTRTVVVQLAAPDSSLPARLAHPAASVVSPRSYPPGSRAGADVVVGSGPYTSEGYRPDGSLELVPWPGWWRHEPPHERVVVRPFRTARDLATAVRGGEVDVVLRSLAPADVRRLDAEDTALVVHEAPPSSVRFLAFNSTRPPFDAVAVRRAVASAVDRAALARTQGGTPLTSLLPPRFREHAGAAADGDPTALLREAGVPDGERVAFTLWYTPDHYGPDEQRAAEELGRQLEATGRFAVSVREAGWSDFRSSFSAGEYQAWLLGWFPDVLDPLDHLAPFLGSAAAAGLGTGYASARADELIAAVRRATDPGARSQHLRELQALAAAEAPYVPLWQPPDLVLARRGIGLDLEAWPYLRLWRTGTR